MVVGVKKNEKSKNIGCKSGPHVEKNEYIIFTKSLGHLFIVVNGVVLMDRIEPYFKDSAARPKSLKGNHMFLDT